MSNAYTITVQNSVRFVTFHSRDDVCFAVQRMAEALDNLGTGCVLMHDSKPLDGWIPLDMKLMAVVPMCVNEKCHAYKMRTIPNHRCSAKPVIVQCCGSSVWRETHQCYRACQEPRCKFFGVRFGLSHCHTFF